MSTKLNLAETLDYPAEQRQAWALEILQRQWTSIQLLTGGNESARLELRPSGEERKDHQMVQKIWDSLIDCCRDLCGDDAVIFALEEIEKTHHTN